MESTVYTHKWEERGYAAPYSLEEVFELPHPKSTAYSQGGGAAQWKDASDALKAVGCSVGSCDICGTSLCNHYLCRDANGRHFVVGCDCVMKLDDSKLTTAVEKAETARRRRLSQERRAEKDRKRIAAHVAALDAQRERNGGLTDREVEDRQRQAEQARKVKRIAAANQWLIDGLQPANNGGQGFVADMIARLRTTPLTGFSPRQIDVMCDIFAKQFGRKGSNDYAAAVVTFEVRLEEARG
jgi:hypothetical protein